MNSYSTISSSVVSPIVTVETLADRGLADVRAMSALLGGGQLSTNDLHRLIETQLVNPDRLAEVLSDIYGVRLLVGDEVRASDPTSGGLSTRFLVENRLVPLVSGEGELLIGVLNPGDAEPIGALVAAFDRPAEICTMSAPDIEACLQRIAGAEDATAAALADHGAAETVAGLRDLASGAPVVVAVDDLLRRALDLRATDIHIEPMRGRLTVRYRIDGVLRLMPPPPADMGEAIISRIKVLASLDIAERRKPQDGSVRLRVGDRDVELRVATLASIHGETLVMRILQGERTLLDLAAVGLGDRDRHSLLRLLDHTHGMIAVAGPTGSGKTTSLAAALSHLNEPGRKIVTIEDPVEYQIPGIVQAQIQPAIGVTFSAAIRSFVRQDPDVILVGEIRDGETAHVAVQAALTGHLVLTTVHANTSVAAVTRLRDLGVANYLLAGALRGIVAQRLVRRLCDHCKRQAMMTSAQIEAQPRYEAVGFRDGDIVFEAVGCSRCAGAGYRGRIAVFEVLALEDTIVDLVGAGADNRRLEQAALQSGMTTMSDDAVVKARLGITSPAEVIRITGFR